MIQASHPSQHIAEIIKYWEDSKLEFSIYTYNPQSILDERSILFIDVDQFDENWLNQKIESLQTGEELAFHSKVRKGKRNFHLPLIDFSCSINDLELAKSALRKVLPNKIVSGLRFYDSGRSMHAYGSALMSNSEWVKVMGAILLANLPNEKVIVDSRWVGHRLMGGFSSLRWTSNSDAYLKTPSLIKL